MMASAETNAILQHLGYRDRRGMRIKTHGTTGYYRGCRCEDCAQAHERSVAISTAIV